MVLKRAFSVAFTGVGRRGGEGGDIVFSVYIFVVSKRRDIFYYKTALKFSMTAVFYRPSDFLRTTYRTKKFDFVGNEFQCNIRSVRILQRHKQLFLIYWCSGRLLPGQSSTNSTTSNTSTTTRTNTSSSSIIIFTSTTTTNIIIVIVFIIFKSQVSSNRICYSTVKIIRRNSLSSNGVGATVFFSTTRNSYD